MVTSGPDGNRILPMILFAVYKGSKIASGTFHDKPRGFIENAIPPKLPVRTNCVSTWVDMSEGAEGARPASNEESK